MSKEELETQAEKICEYTDQIHRDCFVNGYVTGALKREQKIADIKANCDFALEGKDVEIKELKEVLKGLLEEEEKGLWFKADGSDKSRYYKLREKAEKILER